MKRNFSGLSNDIRSESGQTLVLVALSMTVLMGFLGLAIDVGNLRAAERKLQQAADAAAIAGALEMSYCTYSSGTPCDMMTTAASHAVTENGFSSPSLSSDTCTTPSISSTILVLNWGPCLVSTDPNKSSKYVVEAQVGQKYNTFFARVLGVPTVTLTARAEAGRGNSGYCMFVDTKDYGKGTGSGTLDLESGDHITLSCGIQDDGQMTGKNGSHVDATQFEISASSGGGSNQFNPGPSFNAPQVPDPICTSYPQESSYNHSTSCGSELYVSPAPAAGGSSSKTPPTGCTTLSGSVAISSLIPGSCYSAANTDCSKGSSKTGNGVCDAVTLSGGGTLAAGTYIFNGNFNVGNNNISSDSAGVELYFMNGSMTNAGGSRVNLSAPTSDMTVNGVASQQGMLIWMDPQNTVTFPLASGSQSNWNGIILDPYGTVDLSDGSNATAGCSGLYTILDAYSIISTHGSKVTFNLCSDYSSLANGDPIKAYTAVLTE